LKMHAMKDSDFQLCGDLDYAHLCGRPLGLKVTLHLLQPFKYKKSTTKNTNYHRHLLTLT